MDATATKSLPSNDNPWMVAKRAALARIAAGDTSGPPKDKLCGVEKLPSARPGQPLLIVGADENSDKFESYETKLARKVERAQFAFPDHIVIGWSGGPRTPRRDDWEPVQNHRGPKFVSPHWWKGKLQLDHARVIKELVPDVRILDIEVANQQPDNPSVWLQEHVVRPSTASQPQAAATTVLPKETETQQHESLRAELLARTSAEALLRREFPPEEELLGAVVTKTARVFIVGSTGVGKTNLGLAMTGGMTSGKGFLNWRCARPVRVLYIDGEMPLNLLQQRVRDLVRRLGSEELVRNLHLVSWQEAMSLPLPLSAENQPLKWAPLNSPEGQDFVLKLCDLINPDVVIFDNVQSLVSGDMKDEIPWNETMPLVHELTARGTGQVWLDHTGWNTSRQYGSSRKAWQFDAVGILEPLPEDQRQPGELAFKISFDSPGKARRRTPDNWDQFSPQVIRLRDDRWTTDCASQATSQPEGKVPPSRQVFYEALLVAIAREGTAPGETTRGVWAAFCVHRGLIDPPQEGRKNDSSRLSKLRTAQSALVSARWIAVEGDRVIDLKNTYG